MRRAENWPGLLATAIEEARNRPFVWGEHDCALFAADVVLKMTGQDLAADFRGLYASKTQAIKILGAAGGLDAVVTGLLGWPLYHPKLAQRGDVVMVDTPEGRALGICNGATAACAGPDGLTFVEMTLWLTAWRV